jgi:hypothetical protein
LAVSATLAAALCLACDESPVGCEAYQRPEDQAGRVTVQEGVWGQVWLWEGDFQPTIAPECPDGRVSAASRVVHVFKSTPNTMTVNAHPLGSPLYKEVMTELVDSVRSDARGFFQLSLSPGEYSFFVRIDSLFYANEIREPGRIIQPATVPRGGVVKRHIDVCFCSS